MRLDCTFVAVLAVLLICGPARAAEAPKRTTPAKTPDCVYVGTPHDVVMKMLEMAEINKSDLVCDPGCGDGRMVINAARKYGCHGIGYEIDPKLIAQGRNLAKKRKVDDLVKIEDQDIFKVDYSPANVIVMYLLPGMITRLLPQFEKLQPGARIVAHDYPIKGAAAAKAVTMVSNEDNVEHTLYLYRLPLEKTR